MSNSVIIPKEQLTAFERWELASFDPHAGHKQAEAQQAAALATVAELENLRQQAHDEGYTQGREAGYAEGIQQARNEAAQMHTLMQNLQTALNEVDEQVAQSLLDLSLEVARQMVRETLHTKPEVILKIVSDAISGLPHFNQNAHLILHPDDAALVQEHMGEQLAHAGWKIFTDTKIERGGCRVETAHSRVDGTTEARWKRIVESIGQDKSWRA
ncbi:flagellar assembly protein H [Ferrigenium kumadai]|uniref:Flagellar assembly protein FliH n=1 Tax=Ferrigenium kumadai TaxID=1682490 RepID=A0AAN1W019_9PROT|nr:flagellar assembly protein FliH [Ferrigenium kumadai]BBI98777.1 flagellar assembly protein H [Ferrigenium kumadai]